MTATKIEKPKQDLSLHTGSCGNVPACRTNCRAFALGPTISGWPTCLCGHTQHIHTREEVDHATA